METLSRFLSWMCGQAADRSWLVGGEMFPVCERCTGIYLGAAVAVMLGCWKRSQIDRWLVWIEILLVLQLIPAGLHWCFDTPVLRTLSGGWFGIGLIGLLAKPLVTPRSSNAKQLLSLVSAFIVVTLVSFSISLAGTAFANSCIILILIGLLSVTTLIATNMSRLGDEFLSAR